MEALYAHDDLDARSQLVSKGKNQRCMLSAAK